MRLHCLFNWLFFMFTGNPVRTVGTVADNLCSDLVACITTYNPTQLANPTLILLMTATTAGKCVVTMNSTRVKHVKLECE